MEDQYDNQLKNIDSYIDVFARFDLSELSEEEARIIEMVHNGQIDEAVKEYDKLNIIEKYETTIGKKQKLTQHIEQAAAERELQQQIADSILSMMQRQHVKLAEMSLQMKREEMADSEKYRHFVKSALDTFEVLYEKAPDRYQQDLNLLKEEWKRLTEND